MTATAITCIWF